MEHDRYIDLSIINIEKSISNNVSADDILKEFTKQGHRLLL